MTHVAQIVHKERNCTVLHMLLASMLAIGEVIQDCVVTQCMCSMF